MRRVLTLCLMTAVSLAAGSPSERDPSATSAWPDIVKSLSLGTWLHASETRGNDTKGLSEGPVSGDCQLRTRARALNSEVAEIDEKRREMRLIGRTRAGTCNYPSGADAPISHRIARLSLGEEWCASEIAEASSSRLGPIVALAYHAVHGEGAKLLHATQPYGRELS